MSRRGAIVGLVLTSLTVLATACANVPAPTSIRPSDPIVSATPEATEEPLGVIEDTRVVFYRTELSVINDSGVLLNLVARDGGVGIRFYKDFGFGNERQTNPWHMGWIEGTPGYQGLAILRDWLFTAALWDEEGRLTVGRLDPHPPANPPADARFHVRGTLDEVQTMVEAPTDQEAPIFLVTSVTGEVGDGQSRASRFAVDGNGQTVIGSPDAPMPIVVFDTETGAAYTLSITNGELVVTAVEE